MRQQSHQHTHGGLGIDDDDAYDKKLEAVLVYLDAHLELETEANSEDMWDYQDKDEDWDGNDQYWGKKVKEACRHECKEHRIRSCCVEKI